MSSLFPRALSAALIVYVATSRSLAAQQADVIRGRITSEDGQPVHDANVRAASIPNNVTRTTRTDRDGRFSLTFAGGDGDYWVTIAALGFDQKRFEVKRIADEAILIADGKLTRAAVVLAEVRVRGERARPTRNDNSPDASGTEKTVGAAGVDPSQAGNLAAMAASLPGVQLIPGADGNPDQFSVFGLGGDQNNSTLNGFAFGGGDVPRDAATRASLSTSPWDVSRGGFSGGQFAMRTQSGSNFSARGVSSLATAPQLEWTDRAGRSAGAEFTSLSLGASTSGPIVMDRAFYNVGYQLDRRVADLQSLTTADPLALQTAGVARDSVDRLRSILSNRGVPTSVGGLPTRRQNDRGLFLGTLDFSPPSATSGQSFNITAAGTFSRFSSPFSQVTAFPTADAQSTNWFGVIQGRHTDYFDSGILTETSVGISRSRISTDPYLAMPSGTVRVMSALDDGSSAISQLSFGGSATQVTSTATLGIGAQNQLSWFTLDNKHRVKLTTELRWDQSDQNLTTNPLGTFSYNSLADLESGRATSFSRLLSPRRASGSQIVGALALGDSYRARPSLQLQYGVRVDANRFLTTPTANPDVASAFGADNTRLPSRLYVSPRVGFSWTYGSAPQLAVANGFVRGPRAVLRGGIGLFQNMPNTAAVGGAMSNTGLTGGVQQLACVGSAVPVADWPAYRASTASIPMSCADGTSGTVFGTSAPNVVLFADGFAAQRSARTNLNWSGAVLGNRLQATVDATYSRGFRLPGMVDLNFDPTPRFTLAGERDRPIFVQPTSIVPATGAVAAQDARLTRSYARVVEQRSDLESRSSQLSVGLQPLAFNTRYSWNLTYVYATTRDQAPGAGSTAGDPRSPSWARSSLDSRHQLVYGLSYNFFDWFPVSLTGSFRSGRPFTPQVAGDINGDGFMNDRAFVVDPSAPPGDPALAAGLGSLISRGSRAARDCLTRQLGRLAERNSCEGPWTSTSNLTIGLNPQKLRLPQRVNLAFYVNNAFGAADLLLRGEKNRRGWGQGATPDQALLFVRGFDPTARTFKYDVNPRFGATGLGQTVNRNPVILTAQARVDVGFTRERQLLTQSLDRGRARPGPKPNDQAIRGMSTTLIPPNPMALILAQGDSLRLTRRQADSLATLNFVYANRLDSIWTPVARYLADLPPSYDRAGAYQRYRDAREASVDMLIELVPLVRGLLTPAQTRLLPALVTSSLDTKYLAFVRSSTAGGANLGMLGMLAQMGWQGVAFDAAGGGQSIMLHR
jgi:hypothetical protein